MSTNATATLVELQDKIPALKSRFMSALKAFHDAERESGLPSTELLMVAHSRACEYFNAYESLAGSSLSLDAGAAFLQQLAEDAIEVLKSRSNYQTFLRQVGQRMSLPGDVLRPPERAVANLQRLVTARMPESVDGLRKDLEAAGLPTTGFSSTLAKRLHIVVSLHGILTRGKWQKELAPELSRRGLIHEALDYGWFTPIALMRGRSRRKKVSWLQERIQRIGREYPGARISIIAHSFGTYIVAEALSAFSSLIAVDCVIFCGAIVRPEYDWEEKLDSGQVKRVLNEYGGLDIWARLVEFVVSDAGPSGRSGFTSAHIGLVQRKYPKYGHSDYFRRDHFSKGLSKNFRSDAGLFLTPVGVT